MIIYTPDADVVFVGRDHSQSDPLVVKEMFVENVYRITEDDLGDTGVLIDIGANIGAVSVWAARQGARVIAVEPEPDNRAYLMKNLQANAPEDSYTILPYAAMPSPGTFYLEPDHGHSQVVSGGTGTTIEVEGITLADVYEQAGVPYSDVLKIDIEGAEYPLIMGTPTEILRKSRYIALEFDTAPDSLFGPLVAKLAHDFAIEILGSPERGGYVYAVRYDE